MDLGNKIMMYRIRSCVMLVCCGVSVGACMYVGKNAILLNMAILVLVPGFVLMVLATYHQIRNAIEDKQDRDFLKDLIKKKKTKSNVDTK